MQQLYNKIKSFDQIFIEKKNLNNVQYIVSIKVYEFFDRRTLFSNAFIWCVYFNQE